ncbi:C-type lectin domain family 17, member A-like [Mizuhopecten yessoensis]|uniref:C-type lectin domain family 17, member A-like n=1 Tax=Mizuhopecten yessoensis TaxID=6573 RepID=UPI000B45F2DC|nr:C-type lectin domain family 17, member A-like [Mizuhopecten yessoensis]
MVYNVNNLACYTVTSSDSAVAAGASNFVVKLRSEIASNLDTSYLCRNHQCGNGSFCAALSSGVLVCMAGLCGQPVSITNAAVNANSYSISAIATYSCNNGYYSIGSSDITCNSSLEWTDASLVCCKDGFTYDQGTQMMYQVFSQNKNYDEALLHCSGLGSGLLKVNNTERMNVLSIYLSTGQFYTDASDLVTEGSWIFSDGSDVDMTLFGPNEPDGGTTENCAIFGAGSKLYDVKCNTNRYFICEVR